MPLDPQVATLLDAMAALEGPEIQTMTPDEARAMFSAMSMQGPGDPVEAVEDRTIPGPAGELPVRVYWPDQGGPLPGIAFFHGGGWVIGDLESHDGLCRSLAARSGAVVMAVDYRRAPEARFPAALDDCYAATVWLAEHGSEIGVDPERLAVAGDSAGGNLAASTCILARDRGGPALAFQLLVYPVTDHSFEQASYVENAEGYFLTEKAMRWFSDHYVGNGPVDPLAAPLRAADLSGLPPAFVVTAEFDPLRDEGEAYAERLREAGCDVRTSRYDGMIHGFVSLASLLDRGDAAVDECADALRAALEAGSRSSR